MDAEKKIIVFTDGASKGNPGPGGFGAVIVLEDSVFEIGGAEKNTTNNRMELKAPIESISFLNKKLTAHSSQLIVYSDSAYLVNGITKWVNNWQKNGWKTATKKSVENEDLWKKLISVSNGLSIQWKQIDGHSGVAGNERCDVIATSFADGGKPLLFEGKMKKYPIKNILNLENTQKKPEKKKGRDGKAYSYISEVEGDVKIHKTWDECFKRVKGKTARFKKVFSKEEEGEVVMDFQKRRS